MEQNGWTGDLRVFVNGLNVFNEENEILGILHRF